MSDLREALIRLTDNAVQARGPHGEPLKAVPVSAIHTLLANHPPAPPPVDVKAVKAAGVAEAADAQRALAEQSLTRQGRAEHTGFAEWLEEFVDVLSNGREVPA